MPWHEAGRLGVLAPEDEAGSPKMPTLEEEAVGPDVLADEAGRPEVFTKRNVRCMHGQKRKAEALTDCSPLLHSIPPVDTQEERATNVRFGLETTKTTSKSHLFIHRLSPTRSTYS